MGGKHSYEQQCSEMALQKENRAWKKRPDEAGLCLSRLILDVPGLSSINSEFLVQVLQCEAIRKTFYLFDSVRLVI